MHGIEDGRMEDVLNPADSLMIPLCLEWGLQASVNMLTTVFYLSYQS